MELNEVRVTIRKNAEGLRFCHDIRCCVSLIDPCGEEVERDSTITVSDRIIEDLPGFACLLLHTIGNLVANAEPSTPPDQSVVPNQWVQ